MSHFLPGKGLKTQSMTGTNSWVRSSALFMFASEEDIETSWSLWLGELYIQHWFHHQICAESRVESGHVDHVDCPNLLYPFQRPFFWLRAAFKDDVDERISFCWQFNVGTKKQLSNASVFPTIWKSYLGLWVATINPNEHESWKS